MVTLNDLKEMERKLAQLGSITNTLTLLRRYELGDPPYHHMLQVVGLSGMALVDRASLIASLICLADEKRMELEEWLRDHGVEYE